MLFELININNYGETSGYRIVIIIVEFIVKVILRGKVIVLNVYIVIKRWSFDDLSFYFNGLEKEV